MCLDIVYRRKQKKEALAKLPESGYYWKVVKFYDGKYYPPVYSEFGSYKIGWNTTQPKSDYVGYLLAYHIFRTKAQARKMMHWVSCYSGQKKAIVRCRIKRKSIINIGVQDNGLCVVTTRFWMPKPKKKTA